MIKRIKNIKKLEEKKIKSLLENLVILLIKKGMISKEDYEKLQKEK